MMHLSELAQAVHGKVIGPDVLFSSVGTDSRAIVSGQLFVALRGEHFDGNAYAQESIEKGAAAALVSSHADDIAAGVTVADTRLALGEMAAYWRRKFDIPLAAITGSNGKTTVKEMLAAILIEAAGDAKAVHATQGNFNNDIGLPLTLLKLRPEHQYAIAEMGMNHAGEISYLTRIGAPTVAVVNNATSAHLGGLGSVEAIARAKGEIFEGLAADGVAVINADDVYAPLWQSLAAGKRVLTFGIEHTADIRGCYQLAGDGSELHVRTPQGDFSVTLPVAGVHNVRNALAATAVALSMGASLDAVRAGLAGFAGVKGRLQHKQGLHGALVIDDTYNANPASMKAAIDVLAARQGQRMLVLGDMGELGTEAPRMHAEIGAYAKQAGVDALLTLGEMSEQMVAAFGDDARRYASPEALADALLPQLHAGVTVLVKGSRFMKMERVVGLLVEVSDQNREHGGNH